jgi:uncharacterized protein (TIGR00725 family)
MVLAGVIGGRLASLPQLQTAEEVGRLLALNNYTLITGGLGGIMEAASKGAKSAGGLTIGILPQEDKSSANRYVDIPVPTGLGIGRNLIIARSADFLIAIGGEYGTLSEIAFGLQLNKPVIGLDTWDIEGVVKARDPAQAIMIAMEALEP